MDTVWPGLEAGGGDVTWESPLAPESTGQPWGITSTFLLSVTVLLLGAGRNQGLEGEMKRKSHRFISLARNCHPFRRVWSSWTRWPLSHARSQSSPMARPFPDSTSQQTRTWSDPGRGVRRQLS